MKVVVVGGLSDAKLYSKLQPLLAIDQINEIYLIRRKPLSIAGIKNYCPPAWMGSILLLAECYRLLMLFWVCIWNRPDRIIAFYMVPHGIYGWLAGTIFRIKTIQLLVGTDLDYVLKSKILLFFLRCAHKVGLRGQKTFEKLEQWGIPREKVFFPPNVFDVKMYGYDSLVTKKYDFLFLGDLVPPKQLEMLLNSVSLLRKSNPDVRVSLVGDGPLRKELEGLAESLGIKTNVFFLGAVAPEDVPSSLNLSRAYIMTSRIEGLPMAMIEALSCGLPVIMPDVGDVTSVAVNNKNSLIVTPATDENFANAMRTLLDDENLYQQLHRGALNTREWFSENYSLQAVVRVWNDAFELSES